MTIQIIAILTPYEKDEEKYLFNEFMESTIINDNFLLEKYLQIERHLTRLQIKYDKLYDTNSSPIIYTSIALKDRMGKIRESKIVKKLLKHEYTYEIRIDEEYLHHRILFFTKSKKNDDIIVLTYGFSKKNSYHNDNLTDELALSTEKIHDNYKNYI